MYDLHQLIGTDNRNTQQLSRRVACILSSARPDCTYYVLKNPLLTVRMVVSVLLVIIIIDFFGGGFMHGTCEAYAT